MRRRSIITYFGLFFLTAYTQGSQAVTTAYSQNITNQIEFLEDKSAVLTFPQVRATKVENWQKINMPATGFFFSRSAFWLRVRSDTLSEIKALPKAIIVLEWKALDSVELFYQNKNGAIEKQIAGDTFPKLQWSLPEAHFPAVEVTPDKIAGDFFYIRLASTSIMNFPILLKSERTYLHDLKREVTIIFAYSTLVVVMLIFALFLYLISRDLNYLIYAGYILSISLAFDVTYGNTFDIFWPEATWWQSRAGFTFIGAQVAFSMLFVSRLMDFKRHMPKADLICKIVALVNILSLPLTLTSMSVVIFSRFYSLTYLVSIPAFFIVGIYFMLKSQPHVRLFIAGWGLVFFFGVFHILYALNIIPFSNFNVYGTIFALPVDIFFFFMSIWEKQRSADRERERLLDEKMEGLRKAAGSSEHGKYQKSSLADVDLKQILTNIDTLMNQEKIYLIENLRLPDLAKAMNLNRTQLSELLNSHFRMTFPQFISKYRIEEAKRLLKTEKGKNILDVAFATGFGSKAAFSSEFKRLTGKTAKEFREQIRD